MAAYMTMTVFWVVVPYLLVNFYLTSRHIPEHIYSTVKHTICTYHSQCEFVVTTGVNRAAAESHWMLRWLLEIRAFRK
jgi:hypothetical protein